MKDWKKSKLMFWTVWLLVVSVLIFVLQQIDFILFFIVSTLTALFMPLLLSGFLYYLLNPIVKILEKIKIKRTIAVALVMILLLGSVIVTILIGIPIIIDQTSALIAGIPDFVDRLEQLSLQLSQEPLLQDIDFDAFFANIESWLLNVGGGLLNNVISGLGGTLQTITDFSFLMITTPVILFYMLHDGKKFPNLVQRILPDEYGDDSTELLGKIDHTIAGYVSGKGTASLIVGILLYIGYTLIGLPSAFVLAIFAGITNFIPYVGPFIGAAPAVIVGLVESPMHAVLAALLVLIVQQGDSNFFTPFFVGKSMSIHPLTVILVLLASANIAGLVGMLVGVPLFAIIKTVIIYFVNWRKEQRTQTENIQTEPSSASIEQNEKNSDNKTEENDEDSEKFEEEE